MRIIAGRAKRLPLKAPVGKDTRPTTDRIKETLFNMLQPDLADCSFLDLFSGSGNIGLEAASRGAKKVVLVENNKKACDIIKENMLFTHLDDVCVLLQKDVLVAIANMAQKERFDIIFADPPYQLGIEKSLLKAVRESNILNPDGYMVIEADIHTDFSYVNELGFQILKEKIYKTNKHVYLDEIPC
ncbi:16S rRNA (guanine(966)-N(2))-methyltransferase RsmD [Eubacterium oxidoreducens]|uniref:16S rRNA (Guanine966-N2)-methyltransferase n=1 Tax=Eubacterium oxidoreducens TaxID=1732 RepID=A0A1G6AMC6_EUBOX|nr:16S rRNA (guanine(966)-N(2))-methyltransferase RsmD [Eubacterium oxidoreducens]SDB09532.1 16S rRNA (guanine966-N2)-methyltransferase [Eubacterium oxidoreducens]